MVKYHLKNGRIEICDKNFCDKKTFTLKEMSNSFYDDHENLCSQCKVSVYDKAISNNGLTTYHYKSSRTEREKELDCLLGKGARVKAFLVDKGGEDIQIHELLDNGLLIIYSYHNHKKITLFAPKPDRIFNLYASAGEIPPESIIKKSEDNMRKGYHIIYFE